MDILVSSLFILSLAVCFFFYNAPLYVLYPGGKTEAHRKMPSILPKNKIFLASFVEYN
jgi:hypothetical protein